MQKNKTSSMVEAGILSAIAVVFAIVIFYIPLLGIFLNMLWPVPLILLGVRHGLKWSVMSLITAGIILAIVVSPLQSFLQVAGLGLIGITLGYCLYKGITPSMSLFFGFIASFISKIVLIFANFLLIGKNPLDIDQETMNNVVSKTLELLKQYGMSEELIGKTTEHIWSVLTLMVLVIPASIIISSIVDTFINFIASKAILKRLGTVIPGFPSFKNWVFPHTILLLFGLSLFLFSYTQDNPASIYFQTAMNVSSVLMFPLMIQGLAVGWFFVEEKGWHVSFKGLLVFVIFIFPQALLILGMFDYIFDFRKIHLKKRI